MKGRTLERLMAARRDGQLLVRALNLETGNDELIDPATDHSPLGAAAAAAAGEDVGCRTILGGQTWFLIPYHSKSEIVIIGAVHCAQALAALAAAAGFHVRVIDPRSAYATQERFANVVLESAWPNEALAARPLTGRSALVALAHDPKLDDAALAVALRSPARYIGALGSRRTHERRLARLQAQGFSPADLARIHGPVGLTIGARTPAEIAIAIMAEMIQERRAPVRVAGIVLAAGSSRRMGHNKLTAPVRGKPMVRHAVDAALAAGLDPVIVVTGHDTGAVRAALAGAAVRLVQNDDHLEGISKSLRAGIGAVPDNCDGAMVLLGDMPGVNSVLIRRVRAAFKPDAGRAICVATAGGRRGHPVLWGRQFFGEMSSLNGDAGARSLMLRHAGQVCEVEAGDETPLADIDTPEALADYRL
jgi:CTP:molybdopterin cytidylyltransferase MocA/xanthine/CO dehydrogenase XdhC/CoxF family maturation factor